MIHIALFRLFLFSLHFLLNLSVYDFISSDIQKLPDALLTIKEEIIESCPKLITKGKPFRAKVSSFERDHVEVIVDCRFELPPVGDEFWNNREIMLLAIDRGVKKCGLQYAKPIHPLAVK